MLLYVHDKIKRFLVRHAKYGTLSTHYGHVTISGPEFKLTFEIQTFNNRNTDSIASNLHIFSTFNQNGNEQIQCLELKQQILRSSKPG